MSTFQGNPYVGPRSFEEHEGELFFGREQEARALLSTVLSERVVLFYAQTGAGKTSLLNTCLRPRLREEGFLILPTGYVSGGALTETLSIDNIYIFNLLLSIDQKPTGGLEQFADLTFAKFLRGLTSFDGQNYHYDSNSVHTNQPQTHQQTPPHLLIIDQFEQLFTYYPDRWQDRSEFFRQINAALVDDPALWILISLREDYLAALDPFVNLVVGRLQDRFYMQRMEHEAALSAIKEPAALSGRPFAAGVAERLVDDLRRTTMRGVPESYLEQYIEPVLLQVICKQLWETSAQRDATNQIGFEDLKSFGNVDQALARYYEASIAAVLASEAEAWHEGSKQLELKVELLADETNLLTIELAKLEKRKREVDAEIKLRAWFNRQLITESKTRNILFRGEQETANLPNRIVDRLSKIYSLLRDTQRADAVWIELTHDRLIQPIFESNQRRIASAHQELTLNQNLQDDKRKQLEQLEKLALNQKLQKQMLQQLEEQQADFEQREDQVAGKSFDLVQRISRSSRQQSIASNPRPLGTNVYRTNSTPIIFLAFANGHSSGGEGYLRNLPKEADNLESALAIAAQKGLCEVIPRHNVTMRNVLDVFADQRYRNHIAIFHFGGHANGYQLLLQSDDGAIAAANAAGFAEFLGQQLGLELVFLNGSSTEQQVQALLDAGVAMVIATAQAIDDGIATAFATHFYTGLGGGATVQSAFDSAVAAIKIEQGEEPAQLYRNFHLANADATALIADRWPWALYVRDGADIAKKWNLPDAAKDPLFGLPSLPPSSYANLPESPFLPLQSFQAEDAALFFGRGAEIRDLYERVTTPTGEPIILFYGQAGVGKSSLLTAGLLPRLQSRHTVRYTRRDQTLGLLGTLKLLIERELPALNDLTTAWLDIETRTGQPLTLILDQVEEVETYPKGANNTESRYAAHDQIEMVNFLIALHQIFVDGRSKPQGKLILGFRKEWLADIRAALHAQSLSYVELYLDRLDRNGIVEAVRGVTTVDALRDKYNVTIEEHLPVVIADDLLADPGSAVAPTLQFLLARLWEGAKANTYGAPVFDQALYAALRGKSLNDFLGDQLALLATDFPAAAASGLILDLLYVHVTPEVTAGQHTHEELCQLYRHQQGIILTLVQRCQDLYLLTDPASNQPTAPRSSRLAHDTLAPLIRKRFDDSDAPGQRARRTLANRVLDWQGGKSGAPLDDYDLELIECGEIGMRAWTADEKHLIDESQQARQERLKAAAEAVQREQEAAAEIARQKARTRQRVRAAVLIGALLVLLTSIGFSIRVLFEQSNTFAVIQASQRNESRLLAARALEQVNIDPVAALQLSLIALPSATHPRPYVPAAEFALIRALQTSMERGYYAFGTTPLTADRVAFAPDRSTLLVAADDALWQLVADLNAPPSLRTPAPILGLRQREDGLLLGYENQIAHVWLDETTVANSPTLEPSITCAQWRPQHEQVALCAGDRLLLWSYRTGTVQSVDAIKLNRSLRDIAWSPSGEQLSIISNRAPAELWSVGAITATNRLTVGSDIRDLAFVDDERFVTWSFADQRTQLWDMAGHALLTYTVATDLIQGFALSPDRTELLLYLNNSDIERRNVANGEGIGRLSGHESPAIAAAWSPSGNYLATSAGDGTARIWNLRNNSNIVTLRGHFATTNLGRIDVNGVYWQDDTHLLTYGEDSTVRRWQVFTDNGLPLCASGDDRSGDPHCYNFSSAIGVGTVSSGAATWLDPQHIIVSDGVPIDNLAERFTFDGATISRTQTITNVEGLYPQMRWSPDGRFLLTYVPENEFIGSVALTYGFDGIIRDGRTGAVVGRIRGSIVQAFWLPPGTLVNSATATPTGALLISRASGETLLFDPITRQRVATITGHTEAINVASVYTPTQQLATADRSGLLQIWDLQHGRPQVLQGLALPEQLPLQELLWNRDGTRLLAAGSKVTLWNTQSGQAIWATEDLQYDATHVAFSPNEAYVAVTVNQALFVLEADNGQPLWQQLDAHADPIVGVRWLTGAPWPNQLADDWFSRFLARLNGTYRTIQQEQEQDRLLLLTWGGDGTARLWDWQTKSEVARFADVGSLTVAEFDPTGSYLLTAGQQKTLRIWRSWHKDPTALLATAQSRLTRGLTAEQLQDFALPTPTATP